MVAYVVLLVIVDEDKWRSIYQHLALMSRVRCPFAIIIVGFKE
jgi:hypothetical protein